MAAAAASASAAAVRTIAEGTAAASTAAAGAAARAAAESSKAPPPPPSPFAQQQASAGIAVVAQQNGASNLAPATPAPAPAFTKLQGVLVTQSPLPLSLTGSPVESASITTYSFDQPLAVALQQPGAISRTSLDTSPGAEAAGTGTGAGAGAKSGVGARAGAEAPSVQVAKAAAWEEIAMYKTMGRKEWSAGAGTVVEFQFDPLASVADDVPAQSPSGYPQVRFRLGSAMNGLAAINRWRLFACSVPVQFGDLSCSVTDHVLAQSASASWCDKSGAQPTANCSVHH